MGCHPSNTTKRERERSSFLFPSTRPLTTHTETREFGPPSGRSVLGDHFRWNRAAEIQPQPVVTYTLCRNHFHGVVAVHPVLLPPPPGVHAGHVPRLVGPPRGSDVPHGPPRQNATHAQMEPVRSLTRGGALRSANTHPVTPNTPGARVVGVLVPPVIAVGSQGVYPAECTVHVAGHRPEVRVPTCGDALRGQCYKTYPVTRAKFVILSVPWDRQPGPTKLRTQCGVWRQRRLYGFTPLRN